MGKIHVVTRKEEIDGAKMKDKIAVVFDVLLATSTIATVLEHGARSVIPVLDGEQARSLAAEMNKDDCMLVGEYEGRTIDGFLDPNPSALKAFAKGKKSFYLRQTERLPFIKAVLPEGFSPARS